ncbi:MAG: GtrA family protein [Woeseiaceae bacterium]
MATATLTQAGRFAAVGAIGFIVDGGILTLLNGVYDVSLLYSRLVSFSLAVTVTWFLNRQLTFAATPEPGREWGRYAIVNSVGALLNMGIFFWLVYSFDAFAAWPIAALAIAAVIALVFNFLGSRHIAFRDAR